jgi:hypothetical protein
MAWRTGGSGKRRVIREESRELLRGEMREKSHDMMREMIRERAVK